MTRAAGAIVFAWCLAAAYEAVSNARTLPADRMPRLDQEFHAFARALPPDITVIGYLERYEGAGVDTAIQMHYAAQYALVPHVIDPHVGPEYLIVAEDTERPGGDPRLAHYFPLLQVPGGHRLFRRTE